MGTWTIVSTVIAVIALLLALVALLSALAAHRRLAQAVRPARTSRDSKVPLLAPAPTLATTPTVREKTPRPWVIYNPAKVEDVDTFKAKVATRAQDAGYDEPKFLETTVAEPGTMQAAQAVAEGADLVIVAGGDGTQRAVAAGLAHTNIPIGIVPAGTGNLLARNLDIPIADLDDALEVAFTGAEFTVDLGWFKAHELRDTELDSIEGEKLLAARREYDLPSFRVDADEYAFLVMSGVGFDADMMASTSSELKKSIGWLAYVWSGIKEHRRPSMRAEVALGDADHPTQLRARTVLLANCGQLPGNVALLPDAAPGDGWMDVAVLDTKRGIIGWAELGWRIIGQGIGLRKTLPALSSTLESRKARRVRIALHSERHMQVDGDVVGSARGLSARLDRRCLVYRIP